MSELYRTGRCAICTEPISLCQCVETGDKFAFSTDVDATTKRVTFNEGRAYEEGLRQGFRDGLVAGRADERERIAAWLEGLWFDSCICEPITINDEGVTTPSDYLAAAIRNGEHETGKAKAQED